MMVQQPAWEPLGPCACSAACSSPDRSTSSIRLTTSSMLQQAGQGQWCDVMHRGRHGGHSRRSQGDTRAAGSAARRGLPAAAAPHLGLSSGVPDWHSLTSWRRPWGSASLMGGR